MLLTTFKYKGVSKDGATVSGIIKAYDEYEAVYELKETCPIITTIEAVKERKKLSEMTIGTPKIKEKELAILCSQFSIILSAGLPIVRCVEMVAEQAKSKYLHDILIKVSEDISAGYGMAQSFEMNCPSLPKTFIETVRAGEQSGTLETCFKRLHKYYDKNSKTKGKVVSALTYPIIVIVVAIVVFIIIMVVAVPLFKSVFEEMGSELPMETVVMIAVSDFFTQSWWMILAIAVAAFLAYRLSLRSEAGRLAFSDFSLHHAPFHNIRSMSASAQFANTMSTMISAGLPVIKALDVTSNVVGNYIFALGIRGVRDSVKQGKGISESMSQDSCFPKMLTEMTGVGEHSGSMEATLDVIGEYYDNEVDVATNRLISMLEPAITIGLAVFTVVLLMSVYLPMFSMYGSI